MLDPAPRLGLGPREPGLDSHLVVASTAGHLFALVVDEVEGLLEVGPGELVPRDELAPPDAPPVPPGVAGAVRKDGALVLVLDVLALLTPDERGVLEAAAQAGKGEARQ